MEQLTEQHIRRSMINCSRGEANTLTLPRNMSSLDWDAREFLAWRDPKAPLRGYLVRWVDGQPVGVALRAAESTMSRRVSAMCLLCQAVSAGDEVSLFTARRAGQSGRDGNTVGTYMCADLGCCDRALVGVGPAMEPDVADRVASLTARVDSFIGHVTMG